MMKLGVAACASLSMLAALGVVACGTFGATSAPEPDGGTDVADAAPDALTGVPDGGRPADEDGGAGDPDMAFRPPCPAPKGPGQACADSAVACKVTPLYEPPPPENGSYKNDHPFGIVADRRHVYWLTQNLGNEGYNGHGVATLRRVDRQTRVVETLAAGQTMATALIAVGPDLYWTALAGDTHALRTIRKDAAACAGPCATPKTVLEGLPRIIGMAAPSPTALFLLPENGAVRQVTLGGAMVGVRELPMTSSYPGIVATNEAVFVSGDSGKTLRAFDASGASMWTSSSPGWHLTTTCKDVFGVAGTDGLVSFPLPASKSVASVLSPYLKVASAGYALAADERFVYRGLPNGGGLRRVDTSKAAPVDEAMLAGNVWGLAVTDDAIVYGEHGANNTATATTGAIYLIEK